MTSSARTGVVSIAAGLARATAAAPDWRGWFAGALAREAEERRFFLWIPVAAMGGVALNLAADREPVLWLPATLAAACAALAWLSRARPFALGIWLAAAALAAGFLSMGLRTARVATPVLDHIRIVKLQGYVQEVDLRPQGARLVLAVANAGDMPANLAPRRVRVTTRNAPNVAAGDYVALQARLLPPSHAALPGGYDFARDAYFQGVGAVGSTLGAISVLPPPRETSWRERFAAAIDQARNRLALRVDAIIGGDEGAIAAAMVTGKRDFLSSDARDLIREAGIFHIITISGVQMNSGRRNFLRRRAAPARALADVGAELSDQEMGSGRRDDRLDFLRRRDGLARRHRARADHDPHRAGRGDSRSACADDAQSRLRGARDRRLGARGDSGRQLPTLVRRGRRARGGDGGAARAGRGGLDPFVPVRGRAPPRALWKHFVDKPIGLLLATLCATSATASFMAYHFHDLSPYVLMGLAGACALISLINQTVSEGRVLQSV